MWLNHQLSKMEHLWRQCLSWMRWNVEMMDNPVLIKVNNQLNNEHYLHVESSWSIPWCFHIRSQGR